MKILNIFLFLFLSTSLYAEKKVSILVYHTFYDKANISDINFTKQELKDHILYLKGNGFNFITITEFKNESFEGDNNILIFIDDGNHTVFSAYNEILKPLNVYPVLAIYTDRPESDSKHSLTWSQIIKLNQEGCDLAIHGYKHRLINNKFFDCSSCIYEELYYSRFKLNMITLVDTDIYVYPYGAYKEYIFCLLDMYEYKYAFALGDKSVIFPIQQKYAISRIMLTRSNVWRMLEKIKRGDI